MIEGTRNPVILVMARLAVSRELGRGVRRVGGLVVVPYVTACTCVGCSGVIAVMAAGTFVRYGGMRPRKQVKIAVDGESGRFPAGVGGMTIGTGIRNAQGTVIWIHGLGKGLCMAGETLLGCACVTTDMTVAAGLGSMGPGQREARIAVIERSCSAARRMACKTRRAVVGIPGKAFMLFIHIGLVVIMAVNTGEIGIAGRIRVTILAFVPLVLVFAGVNGEQRVMCQEGGRCPPGIGRMTVGTCLRNVCIGMIRIGGIGIIFEVAGNTCRWSVGIITVDVAVGAFHL